MKDIKRVQEATGHSRKAISKCLRRAGITIETAQVKNRSRCNKPVRAINKNGRAFDFQSRMDAARWIARQLSSVQNPREVNAHICDAANGKYKSAYGYTWQNLNATAI